MIYYITVQYSDRTPGGRSADAPRGVGEPEDGSQPGGTYYSNYDYSNV